MKTPVKITVCLLIVGSAAAAAFARADNYPSKPIKVIVAQPAGGVSDIRARAYARRLSESMGQPFVVENRPGASGAIGVEAVRKAPPDGYTILFGTNQDLIVTPVLDASMHYSAVRDFAPIALAAAGYPLLLVSPSLGVKSFAELVALAKARPGGLSCGTGGHATPGHFVCAYLSMQAGISLVAVPYKGSAPALVDAASGQVQIAFGFIAESQSYIKTGKLVPLTVFGPRRLSEFPDVPTIAELGYQGLELFSWGCFMAPAGTPPEVVKRLNAEVIKAAKQPEMAEWLARTGSVFIPLTPERFGELLQSETAKWRRISAETGIRAD